MTLLTLTKLINFFLLAVSLWLGLYVVTRSPNRLVSWLTGLTLWTIATLPLNILFTLTPLPSPLNTPDWWQALTTLWHNSGATRVLSSWSRGWSLTPTVILWHHITVLLRPGPATGRRLAGIWLGYILFIATIFIQAFTPYLYSLELGNPLYLSATNMGILYPIFFAVIMLFAGMSLANLIRSAKEAPTAMLRRQLNVLTIATVIAILTAPLAIVQPLFGLKVPLAVFSLFLIGAVFLIGFGIANYSAIVAGRTIRRDFIYNALTIAIITCFYLAVIWIGVTTYNLPDAVLVVGMVLAIISHQIIDFIRQKFERNAYRQDAQQVWSNLDPLISAPNKQDDSKQHFTLALSALCTSVQATFGLLFVFGEDKVELKGSYQWVDTPLTLTIKDLQADDVLHLKPGHFSTPLAEAALLIPLYVENNQLGAMLLGRPINGVRHARSDIERLLYPCDRLADAIWASQRESEYLTHMTSLIEANNTEEKPPSTEITVKIVEKALRNITDFAFLGQSPLANLTLVTQRLAPDEVTHLDRGKAIYDVMDETLEKLKPNTEERGNPPSKAWYQYLILYQAYMEDVPNRDIMSYLYISEGTFNRTRRAALRAVTRSLQEMEEAVNSE